MPRHVLSRWIKTWNLSNLIVHANAKEQEQPIFTTSFLVLRTKFKSHDVAVSES